MDGAWQACRVLRAEGLTVSLVNSNPATIMTDPEFSDATYVEPITPEIVAKIIEKERPDALLPTMASAWVLASPGVGAWAAGPGLVRRLLLGMDLQHNPLFTWLIIPLSALFGWDAMLVASRSRKRASKAASSAAPSPTGACAAGASAGAAKRACSRWQQACKRSLCTGLSR